MQRYRRLTGLWPEGNLHRKAPLCSFSTLQKIILYVLLTLSPPPLMQRPLLAFGCLRGPFLTVKAPLSVFVIRVSKTYC